MDKGKTRISNVVMKLLLAEKRKILALFDQFIIPLATSVEDTVLLNITVMKLNSVIFLPELSTNADVEASL